MMIKIPQYRSQVESQVVKTGRAPNLPAAAFDTGAQDLLRLGGQAAQVGFQMHERAQTQKAKQALLGYESELDELSFNRNDGYFYTRGQNAFEGADGVRKSAAQLREKWAKGLDGTALERFNEASGAHQNRFDRDVMRHSSKNLQAWELANYEAEAENSIQNAGNSLLSAAGLYHKNGQTDNLGKKIPNPLTVEEKRGEAAVISAGRHQGKSNSVIMEDVERFRSKFYKNAIVSAIENDINAGKEAYEKWKDNLQPEDRSSVLYKLSRTTKKNSARIDKEVSALSSQNAANIYVQDGGDMDAGLEHLVKMRDKGDLTASQYKSAVSQYRTSVKNIQTDALASVRDMINEGESLEYIKAQPDYDLLSSKAKTQLDEGKLNKSNPMAVNEMLRKHPTEIVNIDVAELTASGAFDPADIKRIEEGIDKAKKGLPNVEEKLIAARAEDLFGKKLRNKDGLTPEGMKAELFMQTVRDRMDQYEEQTGARPDEKEIQRIIDASSNPVVYDPDFGFDIEVESEADEFVINRVIGLIPELQDPKGKPFEAMMKRYKSLVDEGSDINIFNLFDAGKSTPISVPDEHEFAITTLMNVRVQQDKETNMNNLRLVYEGMIKRRIPINYANLSHAYSVAAGEKN
jgi:hypothetical protein